MIDWHSHILPRMDDGSQSLEESLAMLEQMTAQGVKTVIATPHFCADHETVEAFLHRREKARQRLLAALPDGAPRLLCGAEVQYYSGISRLPELKQLCIEGTNVLLLEMSVSRWTEYIVRELVELASRGNLTVILAHVERYLDLQSREVCSRLYKSGILMQVNANCFLRFGARRKALAMVRSGQVHLLGSDCHNKDSRPPNLGKAVEVIEKKLGAAAVSRLNEWGQYLLAYKQKDSV